MGYEHFFTAPDGTELAVVTKVELDTLRARSSVFDQDAVDIAAAGRALAESDVRYPAAVLDAMLAGDTPIAAWRKHRGISQATLAQLAGLTQAGVARLEVRPRDGGRQATGRRETRLALARALGVSIGALEPLD